MIAQPQNGGLKARQVARLERMGSGRTTASVS